MKGSLIYGVYLFGAGGVILLGGRDFSKVYQHPPNPSKRWLILGKIVAVGVHGQGAVRQVFSKKIVGIWTAMRHLQAMLPLGRIVLHGGSAALLSFSTSLCQRRGPSRSLQGPPPS